MNTNLIQLTGVDSGEPIVFGPDRIVFVGVNALDSDSTTVILDFNGKLFMAFVKEKPSKILELASKVENA